MNSPRCIFRKIETRNTMPKVRTLGSKCLSRTDAFKRFSVPTKALRFLPDFRGENTVKLSISYQGKKWPVVCYTRKTGHKKPVFSKGWVSLVTENQLSVGDRVTLYMEEDEGYVEYKIEVDKAERQPDGEPSGITQCSSKAKRVPSFRRAEQAASKKNNNRRVINTAFSNSAFQESGSAMNGEGGGIMPSKQSEFHISGRNEPVRRVIQPANYNYLMPFGLTQDALLLAYFANQPTGSFFQRTEGLSLLEWNRGQPTQGQRTLNLDLTLAPPMAAF